MATTPLRTTPAETGGRGRAAYAVWELTLKCNLACNHCGSRAGDARPDELSTEEAFDLVDQMASVGITEVTIEGGEAFLRKDWLDIARHIVKRGMLCTMVTGGYGISRTTAERMKDAGIARVSVSVDGLLRTHDRIRGKLGSFTSCFKTFEHFRAVGIEFTANTQINRLSAPELPQLYVRLRDAGAVAWQIQLTTPMGNGADNDWMLIQPAELNDLYKVIARIGARSQADGKIPFAPGNDIGYFGEYDYIIFGRAPARPLWTGCQAGLSVLGIHADGSIKGCPTLSSEFIGGNIRKQSLREILKSRELTFNMNAGTPEGTSHVWGYCAGCEYVDVCRGGCSQTATVLFDRRGNNPFCHHRASSLAKEGKRERVSLARKAAGVPFDHGEFVLIEEALDAPWPEDDQEYRFSYDKVPWDETWEAFPIPEPRDPLAAFS